MIAWLKSIGSAIKNLFFAAADAETGVFTAFFSIKDDVTAFVRNLERFKTPKFDPKWKTRVINVPRAYEGITELIDIILHGFRDKFRELIHSIETVVNVLEQSAKGAQDDGPSGIANVQEKLATLKLAVVDFQKAFHTALEIETMLLDVKERLETLEDLFLPQGSSKTTVDVRYRKRNA
jgi:hypothetical protein